MNNFKANIKQKYNISNYQAEQIIFVIKSLGSELSKMLIMGILFRNEILLFLFQLIFRCFLRSFSGGFHFYSYWSCLLASVLYMSSLVFIFPNITLPLYMQIFLLSISFCMGDGNIDGGGGSFGTGSELNVWRNNQDGVRVTVVTTGGSVVATPIDLSNCNISSTVLNFGKVSKLQYTAGSSLSINASYTYSKPAVALPRIISGSVNKASIAAIKRYICSEYAAKFIASKTGIPFENLINGDYKLVIEPIAYFTHNGKNYAMTATEAALYNKLSGGALRRVLPSLTHQNLPLALFLEKSDLGYPAWTGSTSGKVSDDAIISSRGIGIVSYKDVPSEELEAPDYTYRVDTDVISSIMLTSATEVNPKNPAKATFYINGGTYTVSNIVMPSGETERSSIRGNSRTTVWTLRFCC